MATMHEIETHWCLEDVVMANLQITYGQRQQQDANERAHAKANPKGRVR